ncbi:type I methionyl aminopeptidase [Bacillus pseudomycoides]|uniref:Methionine aminopeptidase n=1 Tax=Bacillus pseudomycoides TaxID=64104 RepID=A0AA91ZTR3_9BACI|nr:MULTISPECIES: type I methionyl aminopeptidase [Bacillus]PEB52574.1 type I methionyl aminopeptidase [Bacillus sp. AFS098217]PED83035.1 type I methionyl aminopeptidase [Bacillus pseudomycoides]PEU13889.1 type I methionyl aminopeptidase [Bacillus sp. AFS019443]PEU18891.1 type I methionyl aminopeptidase [Bacillus sp. AFS014408]PFW63647.1 type I methionyl aminopeptidase [Bacillus sp. AFS075034]
MNMIKTRREIDLMRESGKLLASCHQEIAKMLRPGITTLEIDTFVETYLAKYGATPEQKGYNDYPYAICASVNDEMCHGFPTDKSLNEGDIVTIDMVINLNGALADSAWSYKVGDISHEAEKLLLVTENALYKGIEQAIAGNHVGDIGYAIESYVASEGFSVARDFTGHGIGKEIHEEPAIFHFGKQGQGPVLQEGMVITIEPIVNVGMRYAKVDVNGWTARTMDGKLSAQYEHTIAITKDGPVILTRL